MSIFRLNLWFIILTALSPIFLLGCGSERSGASSALEVQILIPEGENPEIFWFGVAQKTLIVKRKNAIIAEFTWQQGQATDVEIFDSDTLEFKAFDRLGRLIVHGECVVNEKKAAIPVQRIL